MKRIAATIIAIGLTAAIYTWPRSETKGEEIPPLPTDLQPEWTAAINNSASEVFQRAFWRRPSGDDLVVHAERIEWSDPADGVAKWQWHLELQPGATFKRWLVETNPFSLSPAPGYTAAKDSPGTKHPSWFPREATESDSIVLRNNSLFVVFSRKENLLYATDTGHGFAPQVVER